MEIIVCAGIALISIPIILMIKVIRWQNKENKELTSENEELKIKLRIIVKQTIEKS